MDLAQILELVRQYGEHAYAFVFAYAASHGLLMVLFAGYAAHKGIFDFATLLPLCWTASFLGDAVRFWIGRRFGTGWLRRFPRTQRAVETSARLVDRHYWWIPLVHRYPNGIRSVAGFAFGMSRLPRTTFLGLNFISAGIWAFAVLSIGYAFGHVSEKIVQETASGLSLALMLAFFALFWFLGKRLDRVLEGK